MASDTLLGGFECHEIVVKDWILSSVITLGISFAWLQSLAGTRGKSHPSIPLLVTAFIKQAPSLSM